MGPYIGLAFLLILIAVAIASQKAPPIVEEFPDAGPHEGGTRALFGVLWRNKRYRFGVVAQFFNVAAQVCTWTFLIQYVEQALGGSLEKGGVFLQISLLVFLFSRFLMTWVIGYDPRDARCSRCSPSWPSGCACSRCRARTWPACSRSSRCRSACR